MNKLYLGVIMIAVSFLMAGCNNVILKADFEAGQVGQAPAMNLPGEPSGDSMREQNSQIRIFHSGPLASKALEFKKPEGMAPRFVDFIATDGMHNSGEISVQFTFVREAVGTQTSSYVFSIMSEQGEPLLEVVLESLTSETSERYDSLTGSMISVIHGTSDGKTAATRLGDYLAETIVCTIKLHMNESTFDIYFAGNSAEGMDVESGHKFRNALVRQPFVLGRTNMNFKTLRLKVDSKDGRSGNIAIDNIKVWEKES